MDYNVDNYTTQELIAILQFDENDIIDKNNIYSKTNYFIQLFTTEENNPKLAQFFKDIQTKLITYMENKNNNYNDYSQNNNISQQTDNWIHTYPLKQNNDTQNMKITDRIQKIDVYDNAHLPMNRQQLGINNTKNIEVAQDNLNPNLENITTRLINIDSQYRQFTNDSSFQYNTDFTLDLSDPLTNVISLKLYSFQIPNTWYTIDMSYGNTCFWIINYHTDTNQQHVDTISIPPGNYNVDTFITQLNLSFNNTLTYDTSQPKPPDPATYNYDNGTITILIDNKWQDSTGHYFITYDNSQIPDYQTMSHFLFFDFENKYYCNYNTNSVCSNSYHTYNNTLGWLMGFRTYRTLIYTLGNTATSILYLYGPKYFILVLDDLQQNHINNALISITEYSQKIQLPDYYNPTIPHICYNTSTYQTNQNTFYEENIPSSYHSNTQYLQSAPRTLTNAQIYTINQIILNRNKNTNYKNKAPTSSDTFALIPIKKGSMNIGDVYVDFGSSLQVNKRIYFGPVNIHRIRIKLLDDKGNLVNLNGVDWSITIISENLYQY